MDVRSLNCRECGAPLRVAQNARLVTCNYCGSHFGIHHSGDAGEVVVVEAVEVPPIIDAEIVPHDHEWQADAREIKRHEDLETIRHGVRILDAITGFKSCLSSAFFFGMVGIFFVCMFCVIPRFILEPIANVGVNRAGSRIVTARSDRTDDLLRDVEDEFERYIRQHRMLPDDVAGNTIARRYFDEWQRPIRYEQNTATDYVLRSAGPDGKHRTRDDETESCHAVWVDDRSRVAPAPKDLGEALTFVASPGQFLRRSAFAWLLEHEVYLEEPQRRETVIAAIESLPFRTDLQNAQLILDRWSNTSDTDKIVAAIEETNQRDQSQLSVLISLLVRFDAKEATRRYLNHPSTAVQASVSVAMTEWDISESVILDQCIEDLARPELQLSAIQRLRRMNLVGEQRDKVSHEVRAMLLQPKQSSRYRQGGATEVALELLSASGPIDADLLMKLYEENADTFSNNGALRERLGQMLVELPEPKVCLFFAQQLANRHDESADHAKRHLELIGPSAESYVWPTLLGDDRDAASRACNVLARIGTEKSIPYLEQLTSRDTPVNEAEAAILEIKQAVRDPFGVEHHKE